MLVRWGAGRSPCPLVTVGNLSGERPGLPVLWGPQETVPQGLARRSALAPLAQIWNNDLGISLMHSADMRPYNWSYTQFSQFNQDDSLLLASGVFLGPHNSSSGEIAVISLGERGPRAGPPHRALPAACPALASPQTPSLCCPVYATSPMTCLAVGLRKPVSSRGTCTVLAMSPPAQCCG
jgi:hypothetical protein